MPTEGGVGAPVDEAGAKLASWVEANVGGRVVRMSRLARWRDAWDVDVDLGDRVLPLHVRGEREPRHAMPYWIADEQRTHDLLEAHGVPVPHVYGYCADPYAMVMDRLAGSVDLSFAADDDERRRINLEYLELVPRYLAIGLDDARAVGFEVPTTANAIALDLFRRFEAAHDARVTRRDPVCEFLRRWLHRNAPSREVASFVTYDSFQFLFDQGRITGLIDFELAHVGDPLTELAALRVRDTIKNLGDLPELAVLWSDVTGVELDHDAIVFHTIAYNAQTVLSAAPLIESPGRGGDLMSHFGWYVNSARWAFEDIADLLGVTSEAVDDPGPGWSRHSSALDLLVAGLGRDAPGGVVDDEARARLFRLARHVRRAAEIGDELERADLDDAEELLGARPAPDGLDAALVAFIDTAGPEHDAALVRLLDRRVQRQHLALGPAGSMMLRHPRLRSLRPGQDRRPVAADDLPWTPGLIAGTR